MTVKQRVPVVSKEVAKQIRDGVALINQEIYSGDILEVIIIRHRKQEALLSSLIPGYVKQDIGPDRSSPEYSTWRHLVFERDGWACVECRQVGGTLNAHHIKSFKDYPEFRLDVNNGVTLCEKCHINKHRKTDDRASREV